MGKSTGRMTGLVSLVAGALLCSAGTVAYAASLAVSSPQGTAGSPVTFTVSLTAGGASVGGAQADIAIGATDPLSLPSAATGTGTCSTGYCNVTTTTACSSNAACLAGTCSTTTATACHIGADCPVGETCNGGQNCVTACLSNSDCKNAATCQIAQGAQCVPGTGLGGKQQALFSFPKNCSVTTSQACVADADCKSPACATCVSGETCPAQTTKLRGIVAGIDPPMGSCSTTTTQTCTASSACPSGETCKIDPIPDTVLYTCTVNIGSAAPATNTYPLTISNVQISDTTGTLVSGSTGTNGTLTVCAASGCPATPFLVCDVVPFTGDAVGEFGDGTIKNNDVVAIFNASLGSGVVPASGTARFDAMDSITADSPPTCGGDGNLKNNDVVACFNRSLGVGANYDRTISGSTCTSTLVPQ